jgi:hypothetical protein
VICYRDREQQTLYVSKIIPVNQSGIGKIHTGLYIAAIRDAIDRSAQLDQPDLPQSWTRPYPPIKNLNVKPVMIFPS